MHKRIALGVSLTLVAALGLLGATAAVAASEDTTAAGTVTWKMIGEGVSIEFINRNGDVPSLGDVHVATSDLYRDGKLVGYDGVTCTTVRVTDQPYDSCYITQRYADGLLSAQVIKPRSESNFYAAITGGTGAYSGARGQIHVDVHFRPAAPPLHYFTVSLERSNTNTAQLSR